MIYTRACATNHIFFIFHRRSPHFRFFFTFITLLNSYELSAPPEPKQGKRVPLSASKSFFISSKLSQYGTSYSIVIIIFPFHFSKFSPLLTFSKESILGSVPYIPCICLCRIYLSLRPSRYGFAFLSRRFCPAPHAGNCIWLSASIHLTPILT